MDFPRSIFTIEVNGVPTAAFEAKWHGDAEAICRSWVDLHRERLSSKGRRGSDLPPSVKVRLSRADEQARFAAGGAGEENLEGFKIVLLADLGGP